MKRILAVATLQSSSRTALTRPNRELKAISKRAWLLAVPAAISGWVLIGYAADPPSILPEAMPQKFEAEPQEH